MSTLVSRLLVAVLLVTSLVVCAAPAAARDAGAVSYSPPVDAPIRDPFRPPSTPYGPGNRGIEYATASGATVAAAADGTVTFAGVVATQRWVTIRHADGIRTTYGPLDDVAVSAGDLVRAGDTIGTSAGPLMLTARLGDAYVDPATLFGADPPRVHLVSEPLDMPGSVKRSGGFAIPGADALMSALDWERRHLLTAPDAVVSLTPAPIVIDSVRALVDWRARQRHCTDATSPAPVHQDSDGRRVAVLVGGLGSSSTNAAVADVDTTALGYRSGDVVRFSYRGGRVPSDAPVAPELESLTASDYGPRDTVGDIDASGRALASMVGQTVDALPPNATVDLIAHSQGGLVARVALGELAAKRPDVVARLGIVVTLGTPHHGADLAAAVHAADLDPLKALALDGVQELARLDIGADDEAVGQLAPGSEFLTRLDGTPLPDGPAFLSIAARGDVIVPPPRARLDGATNVVVTVDGLSDHDHLPGSAAVTREIALAQAGLDPTCESAADAVMDAVAGDLIGNFEHAVAFSQGG